MGNKQHGMGCMHCWILHIDVVAMQMKSLKGWVPIRE